MRREKKSRILQEIQSNSTDAFRGWRAAGFPRHAGARGWMAGNGREMGNEKHDLDGEQEKSNTTDADHEALKNSDVVEWIRNLADEELGKNGREIVQALVERAKKGDPTALKLLMTIAKEKTRRDASMTPGGKTLAQMLAEEPEWQGPPEGAAAEEKSGEPAA